MRRLHVTKTHELKCVDVVTWRDAKTSIKREKALFEQNT